MTDGATKKAIALRQQRKMSLADSILAATALENDWELVSRNVDDFEWIAELRLVNPFDFHTLESRTAIDATPLLFAVR